MNANSKTNFYGRDFVVTNDVLTPRLETEAIVDEVLSLCGKPILPGVKPPKPILDPNNLTILDVGTGSGCIAITLKKELPEASIYATDISEQAIKIATKNAYNHGAHIPIIISHLLEKVDGPYGPRRPRVVGSENRTSSLFAHTPSAVKDSTLPTPDVIVANLPYVDPDWDWLDKTSLKSDPDLALYADDHGLSLIKQLIDQAADLHIKYLILESDPSQHETIIAYANSNKYRIANIRGYILSFNRLDFEH